MKPRTVNFEMTFARDPEDITVAIDFIQYDRNDYDVAAMDAYTFDPVELTESEREDAVAWAKNKLGKMEEE